MSSMSSRPESVGEMPSGGSVGVDVVAHSCVLIVDDQRANAVLLEPMLHKLF